MGRGDVYGLGEETGGKETIGRPRRRWVDNIRMDLCREGVYRVLEEKPKGKRPLGRPGRSWVGNIGMDLWGEGSVYGLGGESVGKETAGVT